MTVRMPSRPCWRYANWRMNWKPGRCMPRCAMAGRGLRLRRLWGFRSRPRIDVFHISKPPQRDSAIMLRSLSRYVKDARTLTQLCSRAEEIARGHGHVKPGSEHFVLAALGLADKTASGAFRHLSLTEAAFLGALASQHETALASIGVTRPAASADPSARALVPPKGSLYEAGPSGQSVVQRLAESRGARKGRELLGADVLLGWPRRRTRARLAPSGRLESAPNGWSTRRRWRWLSTRRARALPEPDSSPKATASLPMNHGELDPLPSTCSENTLREHGPIKPLNAQGATC